MTKLPRYREIADDLRAQLANGDYLVGAKLPSISDMQDTYEVPGLNTVRQALALLIDEGLLESVHGVGTYVRALPSADNGPESLRADLLDLQASLAASHAAVTRVLRHLDAEPATAS